MGFELDWMEREERYRQRVVRLLLILCALAGVCLGVAAYARARHAKAARLAAAQAAEKARADQEKRTRDTFVADSTAAATRLATFLREHTAEPMTNLPIVQVPLPRGTSSLDFVERIWGEYARLVEPSLSRTDERDWFTRYYVDVMNEGPLRPRAVLLPLVVQEATSLVFKKPNFDQISQAQREVGMREAPAPSADSARAVPSAGPPAAAPAHVPATNPVPEPPAPAVTPEPPASSTPAAASLPPAASPPATAATPPAPATPPSPPPPPQPQAAAPDSSGTARRDSARSEAAPKL